MHNYIFSIDELSTTSAGEPTIFEKRVYVPNRFITRSSWLRSGDQGCELGEINVYIHEYMLLVDRSKYSVVVFGGEFLCDKGYYFYGKDTPIEYCMWRFVEIILNISSSFWYPCLNENGINQEMA